MYVCMCIYIYISHGRGDHIYIYIYVEAGRDPTIFLGPKETPKNQKHLNLPRQKYLSQLKNRRVLHQIRAIQEPQGTGDTAPSSKVLQAGNTGSLSRKYSSRL